MPKDIQIGGYYLVHLPDFTRLLDLPTIATFPDSSREQGLVVQWSKDSTSALAYMSGKFGPENILIIVPGHPGFLIDLGHEIRREMQADFLASKAEPFNEDYDYFLVDATWSFDSPSEIRIDCEADSNPREHPQPLSWVGHFRGVYDIKSETFRDKAYNRDFCGYYK